MKKSWLTWLGLGAACAICCAPLIAPLLAGVMGAGAAGVGFSLFGLGLTETLCVAAIAAALAAFGAFVLIHRAQAASGRKAKRALTPPSTMAGRCDFEVAGRNVAGSRS